MCVSVYVGGVCRLSGRNHADGRWGEVVGFSSVKSASRMYGAVVLFMDDTTKIATVVERGVVTQDTFTPVLPLVRNQGHHIEHPFIQKQNHSERAA